VARLNELPAPVTPGTDLLPRWHASWLLLLETRVGRVSTGQRLL